MVIIKRFLHILKAIVTPGEFYFFHALAFVALFALNIFRAKKCGTTKAKSALMTVLIYSFGYAFMLFLFWVETGIWGGQNNVRIFAWMPIITFPVGLLIKMDWRDICDMIAPCLCINQGIAHFGCIGAGCCYGYPWDGPIAIYNSELGYKCFPIQPIEAVTALIITAVLLVYEYKHNYKSRGTSYALMLVTFGPTRFLFEFLRDNEKVFWHISSLALHALFMTVVGIVGLILLPKYDAFVTKKAEEKARMERKRRRDKALRRKKAKNKR